jgi:hypothetical protein
VMGEWPGLGLPQDDIQKLDRPDREAGLDDSRKSSLFTASGPSIEGPTGAPVKFTFQAQARDAAWHHRPAT